MQLARNTASKENQERTTKPLNHWDGGGRERSGVQTRELARAAHGVRVGFRVYDASHDRSCNWHNTMESPAVHGLRSNSRYLVRVSSRNVDFIGLGFRIEWLRYPEKRPFCSESARSAGCNRSPCNSDGARSSEPT